MSKSNVRKITVDPTKINTDLRRPSVFERLGTKPVTATVTGQTVTDYCRNWALNGSCSYGKTCKYASTHTLISPSKRVKKDSLNASILTNKEDPFKRIAPKIVQYTPHSPDFNLEVWNQTDLEYEDEKVLERRRKLLQKELELQMKKDKAVHGKERTKHKKKVMSSSSSFHSSNTSSSKTSSNSDDSSSSSTSNSRKKDKKIKAKRHHAVYSSFDDEKERKKKLKLKRLGGSKSDKILVKKKRQVDLPMKSDVVLKAVKISTVCEIRKQSDLTIRSPSPEPVPPSKVSQGQNQSDSSMLKIRDESDRYYRKGRDYDEFVKERGKSKNIDVIKDYDKVKNRQPEKKFKIDERYKFRSSEQESRPRTPPIEQLKHSIPQIPVNDSNIQKFRCSRTPDISLRGKRGFTPPIRQSETITRSTPCRSREVEKKSRQVHKHDRSKEREDNRKTEVINKRAIIPEETFRKTTTTTTSRDVDEAIYSNERNRQRSKEHREELKDPRLNLKEREETVERCRDRPHERDLLLKTRDREIAMISVSQLNSSIDKSRYRTKEKIKENVIIKEDKSNSSRDRRSGRSDRDIRGSDSKVFEKERNSQRFDTKYDPPIEKELIHKSSDRNERVNRYPREPTLTRPSDSKSVLATTSTTTREHFPEREQPVMFDRAQSKHKRFKAKFERGHSTMIDHDRKEISSTKIDRLSERHVDSPRRSIEVDRNFDRGYSRLPSESWEPQDEPPVRIEYHTHEDDRRKPVEKKRYNNSPFNEKRTRDDGRIPSRYPIQGERSFDEHHHHPQRPIYTGDKPRTASIREENNSNENWEIHHDIEHNRERGYPGSNDWEEREWRAPGTRPTATATTWERESIPRSEAQEEEWSERYDSPVPDWKINDNRKWKNTSIHLRGGYQNKRNERIKEMELGESSHVKRRPPPPPLPPPLSYNNTLEIREDIPTHVNHPPRHCLKHPPIHGNMKEEPINKKLMELAEGRPRKIREKETEFFPKKQIIKQQFPVPEPKRPCLDESAQNHPESDFSDISDDADDILNMEDEVPEVNSVEVEKEPVNTPTFNKEAHYPFYLPGQGQSTTVEDESAIFTINKEKEKEKEKDDTEIKTIDDDNVETMDFEEISDGELEEDIKTSGKGLGDALGVDWESLVKESQPKWSTSSEDSIHGRWQCKAILHRIGISAKFAGDDFIKQLISKHADQETEFLCSDVAMIHTGLLRKKFMRDHAHRMITADNNLYSLNVKYEDNDPDVLKPFTSLFEETKFLLQQEG